MSLNGEGLSHDDFVKLWKGLHYCMWMQDKPIIQEELSQKVVSLLHSFPNLQDVLRFVNVFFITEAREWTGIDRLRLDKFMLLIREMLHKTFELLSLEGWPALECQAFSQNLTASIMNEDTVKIPYGIKMHLADIFVAELMKVSHQGMTARKLTTLMFPFIYFLLKTKRRELAQKVYDRTLKLVFREFGKRPEQSTGRKPEEEDASNTRDMGDEEEEEEEMEEEEEDGDQEDTSDEDGEGEDTSDEDGDGESMDVEDPSDSPKRMRFDLSLLLRLLHRLAKDSKVEIRNRRYVYGIVNSHTAKNPSILQSPPKDGGDDDLDINSLSQLGGWVEEEDNNKKRRKRNRKRRRQEIEGEEMDEDSCIIDGSEELLDRGAETSLDQLNNHKKDKNNKKMKLVDGKPEQNGKKSHPNQISQVIIDTKVSGNHKKEEFKKKRKIEECVEAGGENRAEKMEKKTKKFRRVSACGDDGGVVEQEGTGLKKSRVDDDDGNVIPSPTLAPKGLSPNKQQKSNSKKNKGGKRRNSLEDNATTDFNANARHVSSLSRSLSKTAKSKSPLSPLVSSMECVIYQPKSLTSHPSNVVNKLTQSMASPRATSQFSVVSNSQTSKTPSTPLFVSEDRVVPDFDQSPMRASECIEVSTTKSSTKSSPHGKKLAGQVTLTSSPLTTQKKKKKQQGSKSVDGEEGSGIMAGLYNMVSTPCNMIKKAVGLVAPDTDPGVAREKTVSLPEQLTPGSQKRVVFDLRKNKANKFQDYLKSLSNLPFPAFEPGRSPTHSILRSPSADSLMSTSSSSSTPLSAKRKKGKGLATNRRKSHSPRM